MCRESFMNRPDKMIINKIYKELNLVAMIFLKAQPSEEWVNNLNRYLAKDKQAATRYTETKMFNITNHEGDAAQITINHTLPLHTQKSQLEKDKKGVMWRKGNLPNSWWECMLVQPLWKTVQKCLKNDH